MDFVPYVRISKNYYYFWILEINANLAGLIKIMKKLAMVEKQSDSLKVCNFQLQNMGKTQHNCFAEKLSFVREIQHISTMLEF